MTTIIISKLLHHNLSRLPMVTPRGETKIIDQQMLTRTATFCSEVIPRVLAAPHHRPIVDKLSIKPAIPWTTATVEVRCQESLIGSSALSAIKAIARRLAALVIVRSCVPITQMTSLSETWLIWRGCPID